MTTIRRKEPKKFVPYVGLGLSIAGAINLFFALRTRFEAWGTAETGARFGTSLDGIIWILFGLGLFLLARRTKGLPLAEYDEKSLRVILAAAIGKHKIVEIPLALITRFQASEPSVVDVYFMKANGETIENLKGHPDDLKSFQDFVAARNTIQNVKTERS